MNTRLGDHFAKQGPWDHCHRSITSSGFDKVINSGEQAGLDAVAHPVSFMSGQDFDLKSHSKNAEFGMMRSGHGLAQTCRRMALGVWTATALLMATSPQALAATTIEVPNFGSNPGGLRMFKHIPDGLPASAPLVVVMHGCTQNARDYAAGSGWVQLADKLRLALVMPEQTQANSSNRCFNWFVRSDNRRDQGEALSIRQMVDKMKSDHGIDSSRVFVTGLSAGGAMTSVMLATYPEVFAGGGIVAGLPYGCANDNSPFMATQALQCMSTGHHASSSFAGLPGGPMPSVPLPPGFCLFFPFPPLCPVGAHSSGGDTFTAAELGDFVRRASNHNGPFPRVSIWHGSIDGTVSPTNASEEMLQWTNVHGIKPEPAAQDTIKGHPHQVFKDAGGRVVVETFRITGMAHGVPVDPGTGTDQCGTAGPFVLDVDICSSFLIAKFWGLAP
jgi:poly(hydroxyalkanoate) depolymerase family esterase